MKKNNRIIISIALLVGCLPWLLLAMIAFGLFVIGFVSMSGSSHSYDKIAVIYVSGVITGGRGGGLFGGAGAGCIIEQLEKARRDSGVKAVILRINSPGGSAAGSQEIYEEVMRVRRSGKCVVTSMGDVAASGGYYIASASNKIYANGSTTTGSIGVIFQTEDMSGLYKKIGIQPEVLKTGKYKDTGSPARKLRSDERQLLQTMLMDIYGQFVDAVSKGRKMPVTKVRKLADGRVFTGRQAKKLGLIDALGGLEVAKAGTAKLAGIKGTPKFIDYERGFWWDFGDSSSESLRISPGDEAALRKLLKAAPVLLNER